MFNIWNSVTVYFFGDLNFNKVTEPLLRGKILAYIYADSANTSVIDGGSIIIPLYMLVIQYELHR